MNEPEGQDRPRSLLPLQFVLINLLFLENYVKIPVTRNHMSAKLSFNVCYTLDQTQRKGNMQLRKGEWTVITSGAFTSMVSISCSDSDWYFRLELTTLLKIVHRASEVPTTQITTRKQTTPVGGITKFCRKK